MNANDPGSPVESQDRNSAAEATPVVLVSSRGRVLDVGRLGEPRFRLVSGAGTVAVLGAYGARLIELWVPDRHGTLADITLGFDRDDQYFEQRHMYVGATIGRVAGRIRRARFELDGAVYPLAPNEPPNHLHGGSDRSFDRVMWTSRAQHVGGHPSVSFTYQSPHREEGYPGRLISRVTYVLTGSDLWISYEARTDRRTPVSLTSHAYWNLAGAGSRTVLDHDLRLAASKYTPADDELIPRAIVADVAGTPLDFTTSRTLGDRIRDMESDPAEGYDHNYLINEADGSLRPAAWLRDGESGRTMEVSTTQRALQVYTGNRMRPVTGKAGRSYGHRSAICLEPQAIPNSINGSTPCSVIVTPGQTYRQTSVYRFGIDGKSALPDPARP